MPKVLNHSHGDKESKGGAAVDKMKASNFPTSVIKIGNWEPARQPLFFRETNPQPRKHTLWQTTSDFTGGRVSIRRQHFLEFPHDLFGKRFKKLVQCDPHLNFLSQQEEVTLASLYFEPKLSILDDQAKNDNEVDMNNHGSPSFFSIQDATSPSGAQSSSSKNDQDTLGRHLGSYPRDSPSPCSARDGLTVVNIDNGGVEQLKALTNGTRLCDSQSLLDSDEKTLVSRVNSLCCILLKESANEKRPNMSVLQERSSDSNTFGASSSKSMVEENQAPPDDEFGDTSAYNQALHMPKTDSIGDLLLNLPRGQNSFSATVPVQHFRRF